MILLFYLFDIIVKITNMYKYENKKTIYCVFDNLSQYRWDKMTHWIKELYF